MTLRDLDGQPVAISVSIQDREVVLCGQAQFEPDAERGPSLRITVDDPSGNLDFLILESEWNGVIHSLDKECRHLIRLNQSSLTKR